VAQRDRLDKPPRVVSGRRASLGDTFDGQMYFLAGRGPESDR